MFLLILYYFNVIIYIILIGPKDKDTPSTPSFSARESSLAKPQQNESNSQLSIPETEILQDITTENKDREGAEAFSSGLCLFLSPISVIIYYLCINKILK